MKKQHLFLSLALLVLALPAQGYDFDTGTNQGWTYRLANSSSGTIRTGSAGWSDINNRPNVFNDPTGDNRGSAQGLVGAADYSAASPGDFLILQLRSPNLGLSAAWQNVSRFSAYLLPSFVAAPWTPDLYANMAVVVYDHDEARQRSFVTGTATPINDAEWTLRDFDVASSFAAASPPVVNYDVEEVVINFWVAVAADRSVADPLIFCVDEVSPCATVYNDEVDFRAAAGSTVTYGFESHGLSEDINDLVPSPVPASDFANHFGIAYTNLNGFNVAYQPGGTCNADGDRSLFTHSVVASDYTLTFSDFDGDNRSITAFGLTVCDFASSISSPVSITYDTGTESGTMLIVPSGQTSETHNFVGIVVCPDSAFNSITLTFDDNFSGFQWFDEVIYTLGVTAIPEPATRPVVLHPSYPNPFNPSTTLRFDLPHAGPVELAVYDMSGRLVQMLVEDTRGPGRHEVVWSGRDDKGRMVASGVYVCKLKAGSFEETRSLVLLK